MAAISKRPTAQTTDAKYTAHPSREARHLVKWTEIVGGLAVLLLLTVGLAFVLSTFFLATIGVGQLELRIVILLKNWWVSGLLIAVLAAAVARHRYRLWLRLKVGSGTGSTGNASNSL
ncbi:hypothetical protein GGF37_001080 [Kickxella alabastrina]|nr:hypothetical protein GGF37_001080 [Kickxella alabastrina]